MPSLRAIVGTAGHIDHGKTRLVEALTGIDCDRWKEEKERGITIDLGFAHLEREGLQIGFVDVPGHERFVHNALAGLGGIGIVLLVVAADEGVKPQTREHLEVCSLLGLSAGVVALTKADLVTPDLLELARLEVAELLAGTPLEGSATVAVSSVTGTGIQELETRLVDLARAHAAEPDPTQPPRLPIDRAFHLKGLGAVVTGTLAAGTVAPGDSLQLLPSPSGASARVRSVQVHGEARERAEVGERTALQLTGVELGELQRGIQLVRPHGYAETVSLLVRCRLLESAPKAIAGHVPVRFHLLSSEVQGRLRPLEGRLEPGGEGIAEIRLARPVAAARDDRFVVRRPSPPATLGGGQVLDPLWRRHRGKTMARAIEASSGGVEDALLGWVVEAGEGGLETSDAARRLGRTPQAATEQLRALAERQKLLFVAAGHGHADCWLTPAVVRTVSDRATAVLRAFFRRNRLARGMPKAEAVERILPGRAARLAGVYLQWLGAQKVLAVDGDQVRLPGRSAELSDEESRLTTALVERYERAGLEPPPPASVAEELGAKSQIVEGLVRYLVERGRLTLLPSGLVIASAALEGMIEGIRDSGWERFTVGDFKDRFRLTRKWAIPLLEHLDSVGVTRRVGNERMIARPRRG